MRDTRLQYVAEENAPDRSRDVLWHDYINMSVTAINRRMFQFSEQQHPDAQWVILEFGPEILGDPGVVFCTTNNAYEVAHRCAGLQGFEQMFVGRGCLGVTSRVCASATKPNRIGPRTLRRRFCTRSSCRSIICTRSP